jgi:hypothetical protein
MSSSDDSLPLYAPPTRIQGPWSFSRSFLMALSSVSLGSGASAAFQLVVEQRLKLVPGGFWRRCGVGHVGHLLLAGPPSRRGGPRFQGGAVGDAVQPVADPLALPDAGGLAGEDKKRGLKGVLSVVRVARHAAANAQHHRPMPAEQRLERRLVAPGDKAFQQLPVGQTGPVARQGGRVQAAEDFGQGTDGHSGGSMMRAGAIITGGMDAGASIFLAGSGLKSCRSRAALGERTPRSSATRPTAWTSSGKSSTSIQEVFAPTTVVLYIMGHGDRSTLSQGRHNDGSDEVTSKDQDRDEQDPASGQSRSRMVSVRTLLPTAFSPALPDSLQRGQISSSTRSFLRHRYHARRMQEAWHSECRS